MKKILILLLPFFFMAPAFSQTPAKGSFAVETGLNLSLRDTVVGFHLLSDGLTLRYMPCDHYAVRLGFNMFHHTHEQTYGSDSIATAVGREIAKTENLLITPGIERYFGNWERVHPYGGVEFPFGHIDEHDEFTNFDGTSYKSGYTAHYTSVDNFFGINLVTGVDITIIKGLYAGFEAGLQMNWEHYKDIVLDINDNGTQSRQVTPGAHHFQVNLFNDPFLRIGYWF